MSRFHQLFPSTRSYISWRKIVLKRDDSVFTYIRMVALFHTNDHPHLIFGASLCSSLCEAINSLFSHVFNFELSYALLPPPLSLYLSFFLTFYLSLSFSFVRVVAKARTLTLIKFISSPWAYSRTLSSSNFSAFLPRGTRLHSLLRIYLLLLGKGKGRKAIILELLAHCYYGNRL